MKERNIFYLNDYITGYKNYLHEDGWEKGFKYKGKWNGDYEDMGTIYNKAAFYYRKGTYSQNIQCGKWLIFIIWLDGKLPTRAIAGSYKEGKKHGPWTIYRYGSHKKKITYEYGKVVKKHIFDD